MSIKKIYQSPASGTLATVTPTFNGVVVPVTYSLVSGFQSIDNALFTIDASGNISPLAPLVTEKNYYVRYRIAVTGELNRFVEGNVKIIVAPDPVPVVSGSLEYDGSTAPGTVIGTLSSSLTNPVYALTPLESGLPNPAPETETVEAVEIQGSNIVWTGDVSATPEYDFTYRVSIVSCDEGCFGGETEFDVTFSSIVPPTACGTPNANPTMIMTMTWTDSDVTKDWLNCTWTNGETKELYTTNYVSSIVTDFASIDYVNRWEREFTVNNFFNLYGRKQVINPGSPSQYTRGWGALHAAHPNGALRHAKTYNQYGGFAYTPVNVNIASKSPDASGIDAGFPIGTGTRTGTLTLTNGITLTWSSGSGW